MAWHKTKGGIATPTTITEFNHKKRTRASTRTSMSTMINITFLGAGTMGAPMIERLAAASTVCDPSLNFKLHIWNRTAQKAEAIQDKYPDRVRAYRSAHEAIRASDTHVLVMLFDHQAILDTVFGGIGKDNGHDPSEETVLDHGALLSGKTLVQMSTIGVRENEELKGLTERNGAQFVVCPVLGTNTVAQVGKLQCLLGATEEQASKLRELRLLEPLGTLRHIGTHDQAAKMKLTMNFMVGSMTAVLGNALAMVKRNELDMDQYLDIIRHSAFHFGYIDAKAPRMAERQYDDPNFTASGMLKDMTHIEQLALEQGVNAQLIHTLCDLYRQTTTETVSGASGDFAAIYDVFGNFGGGGGDGESKKK